MQQPTTTPPLNPPPPAPVRIQEQVLALLFSFFHFFFSFILAQVLAQQGWRKGVIARYYAGGSGGGEDGSRVGGRGRGGGKGGDSSQTAGAGRNRNTVALAGSLRRSVLEKHRLDVPEFVTGGGWFCVYEEQDMARQSAFQGIDLGPPDDSGTKHYFLCAGTNGRVYRFHVDLTPSAAPNVVLETSKVCHDGPIYGMQVFRDGSFFSGGRDAYMRLWNPELKIAWEMEKDNMCSEWQLRQAVIGFHVLRAEVKPRGVELEHALIVIMTENRELHRFPLEPAKYRQLESVWSAAAPFAVVWGWKDALNTFRTGLSTATTCILSAAPLQPGAADGGGGSGGGGTLGKSQGGGGVEGQVTGLALHPTRDEYALAIHSAVASSAEAAGMRALVARRGGCVGALHIVKEWEDKHRSNMSNSLVTFLPSGALCCDYSADGSCVCVGLANGEVAFLSAQTASVLHQLHVSSSGAAVRKVRFGACGLLVAVALESREIVVLKSGEGSFSDDSRALKSVACTGRAQGHAEVVSCPVWVCSLCVRLCACSVVLSLAPCCGVSGGEVGGSQMIAL